MAVPRCAVAQPDDVAVAQKRFQDLYAAGDYAAAPFAGAQKNGAAAKRGGTSNFAYVSALNDLARAHQALGRYGGRPGCSKRVLGTLQKRISRTSVPPGPAARQPGHGVASLLQANSVEAEKLYNAGARDRPRRRAGSIRTSPCS